MCGIAGFIDFNGNSNQNMLNTMLSSLIHRGPNGEGFYHNTEDNFSIGLGHKRLSIIDLKTTANQPMFYNNWVIVFNGEIYNYLEIRQELQTFGHHFKTNSDTEVILHAFDQWGQECIEKFIGMFVIVLYDLQSKKLFIYRDRAGVKPLYYYWKDGLFLFSSELKAFHKHPYFKKELNTDALAMFLKYCYVPSPHCIFKHTFKLLPGHYLVLKTDENQLTTHQYWDVNSAYTKSKLKIDEVEAIAETEKILKKAFDYRMIADVPVGVFLSGGYDSSGVAAILQKDSTKKIKTFTIGFHEEKYNEAPYAKIIAERLGTEHTEYYCTIDEAKSILPTLPYFYDEPFGDSSAIPTILVSQLAKKSVTVSLSADGGDEIFGGYNRYPIIEKMGKTIGRMPLPIRKLAYQSSKLISPELIPIIRNKKLVEQRYQKFSKLLKESSASSYLKSMCSVVDDASLHRVLLNQFEEQYTYFEQSLDNIPHLMDKVMAIDYKTYMTDDILTKIDRATMSASLEGREPFLDQHIIEWAARLPYDMKIRKGQKKWLLKEIVHQYLPKEMMDRPKSGFGIPIEGWFQKELAIYFEEYFSKEYIQKQGIFDYAEVNQWLMNYKKGKREYMTQLWNVLMFQMWYEKWM